MWWWTWPCIGKGMSFAKTDSHTKVWLRETKRKWPVCLLPPCTNDRGRYLVASPKSFSDSCVGPSRPALSTAPILYLILWSWMYLCMWNYTDWTTFANCHCKPRDFISCVRGTATHIFSLISRPSWKNRKEGLVNGWCGSVHCSGWNFCIQLSFLLDQTLAPKPDTCIPYCC